MLSSTIREFARATPFKPFVVRMNHGRRFTIQHPDYLSVSPKGSKLIVYDSQDNETHLSALLVASVRPVRGRQTQSGKR